MAKKRTTKKRVAKKADPAVVVRYDSPPPEPEGRDWSASCGDAGAAFCAVDGDLHICADRVRGCLIIDYPSSTDAAHLRNLAEVCAAAADVLEGKVTPDEPEGGAA